MFAAMATTEMTTRMMLSNSTCFVPDWPTPKNVRSLVTTRNGGVSQGVYSSLNLGAHVGDDPLAVMTNRARVVASVQGMPVWLNQVHGTRVFDATGFSAIDKLPEADASFSREAGSVCTVMTADCLPVLFCDLAGSVVAAAHAGWRGLLAGVLEEAIVAMGVPGQNLMAYLGPAIGPQAFEVGDEVRSAFVSADETSVAAFKSSLQGKWLADIYLLARQRLAGLGLTRIYGGSFCTVSEPDRFFSYRRDGQTGRMASLIWLDRL